MKRLAAVAACCLALFVQEAWAQQDPSGLRPHEQTPPGEGARYVLVQSHLARGALFRFDRFTGEVDQIAQRRDSTLTWERIHRIPHDEDGGLVRGEVNYQLFLSGLALRDLFLLNVRTGAAWRLESLGDDFVWEPVGQRPAAPVDREDGERRTPPPRGRDGASS